MEKYSLIEIIGGILIWIIGLIIYSYRFKSNNSYNKNRNKRNYKK